MYDTAEEARAPTLTAASALAPVAAAAGETGDSTTGTHAEAQLSAVTVGPQGAASAAGGPTVAPMARTVVTIEISPSVEVKPRGTDRTVEDMVKEAESGLGTSGSTQAGAEEAALGRRTMRLSPLAPLTAARGVRGAPLPSLGVGAPQPVHVSSPAPAPRGVVPL